MKEGAEGRKRKKQTDGDVKKGERECVELKTYKSTIGGKEGKRRRKRGGRLGRWSVGSKE